MDFPTGPRQPSQLVAEDLLSACTPLGLIGVMRDRALKLGTPLHDKNYIGHDLTVNDPPLDKFIMHELESPYHLHPDSFAKGKL